MLRRYLARNRRLVMPDVYAGKFHNLVTCIEQSKAQVFLLAPITSRDLFVHAYPANGRQAQNVATTNKHSGRPLWPARNRVRTIGRKNVKSYGGNFCVLFQYCNGYLDFITFHKPGVIIEANEVIFASGGHPMIAGRHMPS